MKNTPSTQVHHPALFSGVVQAGFPSPANDFLQQSLDLNAHLVSHPAATFFVRVNGNSMKGAGIASGDILVVDRSITPQNGRIVVAVIQGEFTVKRLRLENRSVWLDAENPEFSSIRITKEMDFQIWGVVTFSICSH